jgi:3-oxoacyl-[acyl-carrier protein] reductase
MTNQVNDLEGKNILVTGCNQGIGRAIYEKLVRVQAFPVGIERAPLQNSELALVLHRQSLDHSIVFTYCSPTITREDVFPDKVVESAPIRVGTVFQYNGLVEEVLDCWGARPIHGLVINAGIGGRDTKYGGVTPENFRLFFEKNVLTPQRLIAAALPQMQRGASIVTIGSIDIDMSNGDDIMYGATKAALWRMTLGYAVQLGPQGIRANMVSPGNVMTPDKIQRLAQNHLARELSDRFTADTPIPEPITPEEVTNTVLFLLSNLSSGMTGQNLHVDKGYGLPVWHNTWGEARIQAYREF